VVAVAPAVAEEAVQVVAVAPAVAEEAVQVVAVQVVAAAPAVAEAATVVEEADGDEDSGRRGRGRSCRKRAGTA